MAGQAANAHTMHLFRIFVSVINTHHSLTSTAKVYSRWLNICNRDCNSSAEEYQEFHSQKEISYSFILVCYVTLLVLSCCGRELLPKLSFSISLQENNLVWQLIFISASSFLNSHSHCSASLLGLHAKLPSNTCIRSSKLLWPQLLSQLEKARDLHPTRPSLSFLENLLLTQYFLIDPFISTCR